MKDDDGLCTTYSRVGYGYDDYPCTCCDCSDNLSPDVWRARLEWKAEIVKKEKSDV